MTSPFPSASLTINHTTKSHTSSCRCPCPPSTERPPFSSLQTHLSSPKAQREPTAWYLRSSPNPLSCLSDSGRSRARTMCTVSESSAAIHHRTGRTETLGDMWLVAEKHPPTHLVMATVAGSKFWGGREEVFLNTNSSFLHRA